jgi:hypothetical protein
MPSRFRLYLAMHEGRAVAGIITYQGTGARYTNGAMIKDLAGPVRANYLLHRWAIEDACRSGSTHYDFGESGGSKELAQFKTRFGALPQPYHEYIVERLPLVELDRSTRTAVKRLVRFREPGAPPSADREAALEVGGPDPPVALDATPRTAEGSGNQPRRSGTRLG